MNRNKLPRWRGFNLLEMFMTNFDTKYQENDYKWISELGFNFVRIPMTYEFWIREGNPMLIDEKMLDRVDRSVEYGDKYGMHVCLNLHRAPGYCVNPGRVEPFDLWKDQEALDAFNYHWEMFAKRYKGISSEKLSFDLVNEPPSPSPNVMTRGDYERVVRSSVAAIRRIDPERLIIADGVTYGNDPLPELADLGIGQSCRAYAPMGVSHYRAGWVKQENWAKPEWPGKMNAEGYWDKDRLKQHYEPWIELVRQGVGVHCGEGGFYNETPHEVGLRWLEDVLDVLTKADIGYSLWNFRGDFGILDSGRKDVDYEEWNGHKLDRKLLELLQKY
jgi:endoglucanase